MTKEDIFEHLRDIIVNILNVYPDEVTEDSSFYDDLGADSLDLFQMFLEAEDVFEIRFDTRGWNDILTVKQAQERIAETMNTCDRQ